MNYLKFSKAWPKKVSWPDRQDYSPKKWLVAIGVVSAVLIAITSLGWGIPVVAMLGMMAAAIVAGTVPFPAFKVGGKLIAKIVLTVLGLIADIASALPRLFSSLYNRITRKGNLAEEAAPDEAVQLDNDSPAAPAIQSSEHFSKYLKTLKGNQALEVIEKKSKDDSTKTVSASVTLDTNGLVDTTSKRTFTISEVNGETILKLDLSAKAAIDPADRTKLLEKMCKMAINNELPGSAFQVHPTMGTPDEREELEKILDRVRAEKAAPSLVAVPVAAPVPIAANEAAAQPAAPAPLPAPESVILAVTPVVDPVAAPVAEPVVAASEQAKERGAPPPAGQGRRARPPPAARSSLKSPKDPVQALQSVVEQNQEAAAPEVKAAVVTPVSHQQIKTPPPRPSKPSNTEVSDALTPAQRAAEGRRDLNLRLIAKEPARDLNAPSAVVPAAAGGSVRSSAIYPANLEISVEDNKVAAAALSESPLDKAITPGYHLLFAAHRVPRAAGVLSEVELEHKHETRNSR